MSSVTPEFLFNFIQTLPKGCSHIEDVHRLFCACFIIFSHFGRVLKLDIFPSEMLTEDYIEQFGCNLIPFLFI